MDKFVIYGGIYMIRIDVRKSIKVNGEMALFISFPYDTTILNVVRNLPDRWWHQDIKQWETPFNNLDKLISKLQQFDIEINIPEDANINKTTKIEAPKDFQFKTRPFQHQRDGFEYGLQYDKWLLADEQGLGKTKQVIDIAVAKKLQKNYKHCLIICGVNGLKWNWYNEVKIHSNETAHILGQKMKAGKLTVGGNADKLSDLNNIDKIDSYFIITNIETLRNKEIAVKLQNLCDNKIINMIALDEAHKCKSPTSIQGKAILKIYAQTMIAMTGTPLMNNPMDLYVILKWLGYEKHSFYAFRNHYCVMGGYGNYQIVGYKNLDQLKESVSDIMLRRLKADVLDLPEKIRVDEYVEMSPKQKKIYDEVTAEIRDNIDNIKMASNPLAELIRMRQATGYTGILSSKIQESAKLDRLEELVEEARENGKQIVIFSNWTQMTDAIYERLHQKYTLSVITGQTKDDERQHNVEEFQSGRSKIMIGTIGAMGTGLTLTAGTVEIFMDEPWNRANKEQAEDRCHRVGTTENVTIYTLMCKDTIDERIHEILEKKGVMADALIDGKVNMDKQELLNFLLS